MAFKVKTSGNKVKEYRGMSVENVGEKHCEHNHAHMALFFVCLSMKCINWALLKNTSLRWPGVKDKSRQMQRYRSV